MARVRVPLAVFNADTSAAIAAVGKGNNPVNFHYDQTATDPAEHFVELDFGGPLAGVVKALPEDYIGALPDLKKVKAKEAKTDSKAQLKAAAAKEAAEAKAAAAKAAAETEEDDDFDAAAILSGTIADVKEVAGDLDPAQLEALLDAERDGEDRSTLVAYLEELLAG